MSVVNLTAENFDNEVVNCSSPVIIDFFATWCGPCKMVSPIIDEIANERSDIKVCKVDVDEQRELATKFGVMSIPTIVALKNGEITNSLVGAVPKSEILKLID